MESWLVQAAVIGGILLGTGAKAMFPYFTKYKAAVDVGEPAPKFEWYYAVSTGFAFIMALFFNMSFFVPLVDQYTQANEAILGAVIINSMFTAYGVNSLANDIMKSGGELRKTASTTTTQPAPTG